MRVLNVMVIAALATSGMTAPLAAPNALALAEPAAMAMAMPVAFANAEPAAHNDIEARKINGKKVREGFKKFGKGLLKVLGTIF